MTAVPVLRLVSLLSLMAGAAGVYWLVDTLLLEPARSQQAQLLSLREELGAVVQRRAGTERELSVVRSSAVRGADDPTFTTANSASTTALIQERVRELVAQVGGVVISSQAGAEERIGDALVKLQVLVRARFTEGALLRFLVDLENVSPPVILTALDVGPGAGPADQPPLDFTGVLTAFHSDAG
jgi:hypothetical protein